MRIATERLRVGPFERFEFRIVGSPWASAALPIAVHRLGDTLVDCGSPNAAEAVVEAVRDRPPRRILCTHQHEDHIGAVGALRAAYGDIEVFVPRVHLPFVTDSPAIPRYREVLWGRADALVDPVGYDEGAVFETSVGPLEAVETPGHTPGHMSFVLRTPRGPWVFTADLYTNVQPVAAWFESSSPCTIASCERLLALGGDLGIAPAHNRARAEGAAPLRALADYMKRETEAILRLSEERPGASFVELGEARYGETPPFERLTGGEFSRACLVRSVLKPVFSLPASLPT